MKREALRKLTAIAGAVLATLAAALTFSGTASAHFTGFSSVVSYRINWTGTTQYWGARDLAIAEWNALGRVYIGQHSGPSNTADLRFGDTYRADVTWVGLYSNQSGPDSITFNRYYMDQYYSPKKTNTALHELGHALGLNHSFSGQVMRSTVSSITSPQSHDRSDYSSLWSGCAPFGGGSGSGGVGGDSGTRHRVQF